MTHSLEHRALVWGARGFIGRALVGHLLTRGWRIRVLTRTLTPVVPEWKDIVECVALDSGDRGDAFDRAIADNPVVFNLAGSSGAVASNHDPIASLEANCRLQLELLAACRRAGHAPHVVFASSRLVYANAGRRPVAETDAIGPLSVYAAHKLCIEHYHRIAANRGDISFAICRISNPYGIDRAAPDKGYGFVNALIQKARAGERMTLFGTGGQLRDYLYIDDLVTMLRLCAERSAARNEVLNVACGTSLSIREAATTIRDAFGGGDIDSRPWPADYDAVESGDFVADIDRARARLEFSPRFVFAAGIAAVQAQLLAAGSARAESPAPGCAPIALEPASVPSGFAVQR